MPMSNEILKSGGFQRSGNLYRGDFREWGGGGGLGLDLTLFRSGRALSAPICTMSMSGES